MDGELHRSEIVLGFSAALKILDVSCEIILCFADMINQELVPWPPNDLFTMGKRDKTWPLHFGCCPYRKFLTKSTYNQTCI